MCLHLQHAATLDISNTVRCIDPNTDILEQLNMYIHEEVEQLYDYIQQTYRRSTGHMPHMWTDLTQHLSYKKNKINK